MSKHNGTKGFAEKLTQLRSFMTQAGAAALQTDDKGSPVIQPQEYVDNYRREINKRLIELCMGIEFTRNKKDGDWKIKLKNKIPDTRELAEVGELLHSYITQYEQPLFRAFVQKGLMDGKGNVIGASGQNAAAAAGMSIPGPLMTTGGANDPMVSRVTFIEHINRKKIEEAILGSTGTGYVNMYLQVSDLAIMVANATKMRKKDRKRKMLIVGGIVILVVAGAGVAAWLYTKKKRKAAELAAELEASCEEVSVNCEDLGDIDDAPVVTL